MPMPIDLQVEYSDGTQKVLHPLRMMSFEKTKPGMKRTVLNDWAWAYPTYELSIAKPKLPLKKSPLTQAV
jgi:hypothetical protein